ncbi:MAG: aminotransferase class I/II-fold pyridoxal phosphate-dependent enzyme [Solirubrobacteraceae bacterium]
MTGVTQYRIKARSAAELVRAIEDAVARGDMRPGQRLPSVRSLALEVGLSPATVSSGLAELRRRGVVLTEQRRGSSIGQGAPIRSPRPELAVPANARDLSRGNPDPQLLPDLDAALSRSPLPRRLYGEAPILPELASLARAQLRGEGLDGEELCVVSGAMDGIERVLEVHLRPGDTVAVESPGYAALHDLLRAQGLVLEAVGMDDRGMLPGELHGALSRGAVSVIVTPRGQNPTGAALDGERATALREVLSDFPHALLIEDDHLGPVAGAELQTLSAGRERWAAMRSVAKALGPDLRLAVLTGDARTVARVEGRQQCGPGWVSHILQTLVLNLWSDRDAQAMVAKACSTYGTRRRSFIESLHRHGIDAHGASGLNVWVPVEDEAAVVGSLLQRGWVVAAGTPYRLTGSDPAIRVTTATLEQAEAERLARDLAQVLASGGVSRSG